MCLFRFQHPRGVHLLPHERHREPDPRAPGLPPGLHARLPERGEEDRRHPDSVSAIRFFIVDAVNKDYTYINDF